MSNTIQIKTLNCALQSNGKAQVTLQQNRQGHYVTNGAINGTQVTFLLDTGATQVSIPGHIAETLSLQAGANIEYKPPMALSPFIKPS